jgi:hypothetical protein
VGRRVLACLLLFALAGCGATEALQPSYVHGDAGPSGSASGGHLGGGAVSGGAPSTGGAAASGGVPTLAGGSAGTGGALDPTGGSPGADGGATGTGGAAGCPFTNTTLVWGPDGGLRRWAWHASLGPEGFKRWTDDYASGETASVADCWSTPPCTEGVARYDSIRQALATADVQAAIALAPVLYGGDPRPVDGDLFELRVNDRIIDIGTPCWPYLSSCNDVPPGVLALAVALLELELKAVIGCAPKCRPEPRVMRPECSQSGLYVWTGGTCEQTVGGWDVNGLSCGVPQYYTVEDCVAGHAECLGLFTRACGGPFGGCDADQYCAYTIGYDCGRTGAQAICLPRPDACATGGSSTVCGCDGKLHSDECFAAGAGTGRDSDTACTWPCTADGDCTWQAQYCFEQGGSGIIGLTPFCLDGICQCACGHRDATGAFVGDGCD